jgi:hypothetical protein
MNGAITPAGDQHQRRSTARSTHRPDLTLAIPDGQVMVEVELQRKDTKRLAAILSMYRGWMDESRIAGVVYVCGSQHLADRVREFSLEAGIPAKATRIELLDSIHTQTTRVAA